MTDIEKKHKPNYLWSIATNKCPRCRRGDMFKNSNPYKKLKLSYIFDMYDNCPVCGQKFDLEPGFWYGTGYISYAMLAILSGLSFLAWWAVIGISTDDNRVLYWLIFNGAIIVILQPWFMRFSRSVYLNFFVKFNENYETEKGRTFD